ncbi:BTB/POZ domain-containing protein 6-A-like [Haliotis cracherodii]|uniref:BTB/POZ domain-containing protein 6-A-like n=1 Tax=Haliotis cracherodii TaxID=6455 RepID=UPI0039E7F67A
MAESTLGNNSDVVFLVGPEEVAIVTQRDILINQSPVFRAMLCGPLSEKGEIKIPDVEEAVFAIFVGYLNTGRCEELPENVGDLLYIAEKYDIENLSNLCVSHLENNVCPENASDVMQLMVMFDEGSLLYHKAMHIIIESITHSSDPSGFTDLSPELFDRIICSPDLDINIGNVLSAVSAWAEAECNRKDLEVTSDNIQAVIMGTSSVPETHDITFSPPVGWISLQSSHDAVFHSLKCYVSHKETSLCHIEVGAFRNSEIVYLLNMQVTIPPSSDENGIVTVRFSKPVFIKQENLHYVQVRIKGGGEIQKKKIKSTILSAGYAFVISPMPLRVRTGLIASITFSDGALWQQWHQKRNLASAIKRQSLAIE